MYVGGPLSSRIPTKRPTTQNGIWCVRTDVQYRRLNAQDPPRGIRLCRARMVPRAVQKHVERMGTRASVPEVRYSSLSKIGMIR